MADSDSPGSKFNLNFGDVTQSQFVTGDYATVSMTVGLTPQETAQLRDLFDGLRSVVAEQAPAEQRAEAEEHARELEQAVVSEQPDPDRVRVVLRWFKEQAPQLAGAVVSVVVNPLVGKVVEGAGEAIADRFRTVIADES